MSEPKDPQKHMQWKKKISESNKISYLEGKLTGAFKKNSVPWNKGKTGVYSKEILERMSESHKGHIPWNKGKKGIYSEMKIENIGRPFTGRIIKCKICDKSFKVSPSRTKAGYCSKKCFIESLMGKIPWNKEIRGYQLHRTGIYKKCKICNKEIYSRPHQIKTKKYCSIMCQLADHGFKKGCVPVTKGKHLSIEHRRILSESAKKRIGSLNHFYGKHHNESTKKIISEKSKERMKDINYKERILKKAMSGRGKKPNNREKEVNILLNKIVPNQFKYVGDGYTFIGGLNPDFIDFKEKIIIEFFGCYIHACPICYPWREVKKTALKLYREKHFLKYGYKTLIIWEHELKNERDITNRIRGFLNENNLNKSRQSILDKF